MTKVAKFDAEEERRLLQQWIGSTSFDEESTGIPPMAEEEDDEKSYGRALSIAYKLITPGGRVGTDRSTGSRSNRENWVERSRTGRGHLPKYIRIVRNGLMRQGHGESRATALAVAAMKRWARGGDNVSPKVQAAAAKALAQWEAMKAEA